MPKFSLYFCNWLLLENSLSSWGSLVDITFKIPSLCLPGTQSWLASLSRPNHRCIDLSGSRWLPTLFLKVSSLAPHRSYIECRVLSRTHWTIICIFTDQWSLQAWRARLQVSPVPFSRTELLFQTWNLLILWVSQSLAPSGNCVSCVSHHPCVPFPEALPSSCKPSLNVIIIVIHPGASQCHLLGKAFVHSSWQSVILSGISPWPLLPRCSGSFNFP